MGGLLSRLFSRLFSHPPSPSLPPPSHFLSEPWRTIHWGDNQSTLQHVKDYKPPTDRHQIRILLHGPAGAGKSSFINSVQSVLQGRMYRQALVDHVSSSSFTRQFRTYKIPKEDRQSFYPFVFNDMMGLEKRDGVLVDDVKLALRGHMRDSYKFDPESRLSEDDPFYNKDPSINDKVHVLVLVIDINTLSVMSDEIVQKFSDIRSEASDLGIPQVVIFTKIDVACPEIKKDLKKVYKVQHLKEKMEKFKAKLGIPENCIFPVKNYHDEINLNSDVDSLILSALTEMIHCGDDYINLNKSHDRLTCFNKV
ncbi:interferon-induced protein 44-like [Sparus aurata]|uniref:interferon-induced protein 44-like n=1 Tax=Sparus aurata TaxID=8175 RepID=UPI0011C0DED3|nr:interferon-induced protein 44-like [Sparus aurata]